MYCTRLVSLEPQTLTGESAAYKCRAPSKVWRCFRCWPYSGAGLILRCVCAAGGAEGERQPPLDGSSDDSLSRASPGVSDASLLSSGTRLNAMPHHRAPAPGGCPPEGMPQMPAIPPCGGGDGGTSRAGYAGVHARAQQAPQFTEAAANEQLNELTFAGNFIARSSSSWTDGTGAFFGACEHGCPSLHHPPACFARQLRMHAGVCSPTGGTLARDIYSRIMEAQE